MNGSMKRVAATSIGLMALSACAAPAKEQPRIAVVPTAEAATPAQVTVKAPPASDVASIIGEGARSLTGRFGSARIDLTEGQARKLQFVGQDCVLDIYLYPVAAGTDPVATHVDARLRRDGSDTDKARCIAEVRNGH